MIRDTITLLRFPFSVYLLPVYLFAVSQAQNPNWQASAWVFMILHLLVYPSSNGYNSYQDQDTDSIGGIEKPPEPPKVLLYVTMIMDCFALLLSYMLVSEAFAFMALGYILASRAYSSRQIRLKKHPIISFLVVFVFQGAYTYLMVFMGTTQATMTEVISSNQLLPAAISSLMVGGGYPLTQIYQHRADAESGDTTLSMLLGYKGTFVFSIVIFSMAILGLFYYFLRSANITHFVLFQLMSLPLLIWFFIWLRKVWKNHLEANFGNTMRMNNISAISLNGYYAVLIILNHTNIFA